MSELAQRIILTHKSVARRAKTHLRTAFNLTLSTSESLDLVAYALGEANWPTLLALAKEGRGPRIEDGPANSPVSASAPSLVSEKSTPERLAEYFGTVTSGDRHPRYTREGWEYEVKQGGLVLSYWEYVNNEIERANEMLPWERDASFAVKMARRASMKVDSYPNIAGWHCEDPWGYLSLSAFSSEQEAWGAAASGVQRYVARDRSLSAAQLGALTDSQWLEAVEKVHLALATSRVPEKSPDAVHRALAKGGGATSDNLDGDGFDAASGALDHGQRLRFPGITKDGRALSPGDICQALGITEDYSDKVELRSCAAWNLALEQGVRISRGEVRADIRKHSETIAFCRALGINVEYSTERESEGKFWTAEGRYYAYEGEAYRNEEDRVFEAVMLELKIDREKWDGIAFPVQVKLALQHRLLVPAIPEPEPHAAVAQSTTKQ